MTYKRVVPMKSKLNALQDLSLNRGQGRLLQENYKRLEKRVINIWKVFCVGHFIRSIDLCLSQSRLL